MKKIILLLAAILGASYGIKASGDLPPCLDYCPLRYAYYSLNLKSHEDSLIESIRRQCNKLHHYNCWAIYGRDCTIDEARKNHEKRLIQEFNDFQNNTSPLKRIWLYTQSYSEPIAHMGSLHLGYYKGYGYFNVYDIKAKVYATWRE